MVGWYFGCCGFGFAWLLLVDECGMASWVRRRVSCLLSLAVLVGFADVCLLQVAVAVKVIGRSVMRKCYKLRGLGTVCGDGKLSGVDVVPAD